MRCVQMVDGFPSIHRLYCFVAIAPNVRNKLLHPIHIAFSECTKPNMTEKFSVADVLLIEFVETEIFTENKNSIGSTKEFLEPFISTFV